MRISVPMYMLGKKKRRKGRKPQSRDSNETARNVQKEVGNRKRDRHMERGVLQREDLRLVVSVHMGAWGAGPGSSVCTIQCWLP